MDWKDLLIYILESLCGLVITVGIPYAVSLLREKIKNEQLARILDRAAKIVSDSVLLVNQTYVDALKEAEQFDEAAQAHAFETCKAKIIALLNEEAIKAIYETYGDLEAWLKMAIEASVRQEKLFWCTSEAIDLDEQE
jgi:hypothetical protein